MVFFIYYYLYIYIYIFFKTFQNFCYPNSIQLSQIPHPSSLTLSSFFCLNLKFFYLSQFLSLSINSNVPLGFNFLQFSISFLNIIPYYLNSLKNIYIYIYIYIHMVIYISLLNINITLNQINK